MWPGETKTIRFTFEGPSLQSILDCLPTAKVIANDGNIATIEAEVYGLGIKHFLLSQGPWVKVLSPASFVEEMKTAIEQMNQLYDC